MKEMDLIDRWVLVRGAEFSLLAGAHEPAADDGIHDIDAAVGFVYIDHEAGTTLEVAGYCRDGDDGRPGVVVRPDAQTGPDLMRYDSWAECDVEILGNADAEALVGSLDIAEHLICHRTEALAPIRADRRLDPFRAPGHPDDLLVMFLDNPRKAVERVWCRAEEIAGDGSILATLLTEPRGDLGFHRGDRVGVRLTETGGGAPVLIARFRVGGSPDEPDGEAREAVALPRIDALSAATADLVPQGLLDLAAAAIIAIEEKLNTTGGKVALGAAAHVGDVDETAVLGDSPAAVPAALAELATLLRGPWRGARRLAICTMRTASGPDGDSHFFKVHVEERGADPQFVVQSFRALDASTLRVLRSGPFRHYGTAEERWLIDENA